MEHFPLDDAIGLPPAELLVHYLAGECTPAEIHQVETWIRESAANHEVFEAAQLAWNRSTVSNSLDPSEFTARVRTAVTEIVPNTQIPFGAKRSGLGSHILWPKKPNVEVPGMAGMANMPAMTHAPMRLLLRIVAAAAGAFMLAVLGYAGWSSVSTHKAPSQTYVTRSGERRVIHLADGSSVTLAPQTSMTVNSGFGRSNRTISLTGLASFNVASSAGAPFIVRTGNYTTRVLGTEFMLRHYADDRNVVLYVQSGKVTFGRNGTFVATTNTMVIATDSSEIVQRNVDLHEYMEWVNGRLIFTDAAVEEVASVLEHWYGLTFKFADSTMVKRHVSGIFDDREPRQEVLQALRLMLGATMQFDGSVVTLVPQHSSPMPRLRPGRPTDDDPSVMQVGQ